MTDKPSMDEMLERGAKLIYAWAEGCDAERADAVWRQAIDGDDYVRATRQAEIAELRELANEVLALTTKDASDSADEVEPVAWLIREIKRGKATVLYGHMFKSKEAAEAAALRLTNQWRLCIAFPVVSAALSSPNKDNRHAAVTRALENIVGALGRRDPRNESKLLPPEQQIDEIGDAMCALAAISGRGEP